MAAYETTVVWRWLQAAPAGADERGDVVRALKKRKDMPHMFANKTGLYRYLVGQAKLSAQTAERHVAALWDNFAGYRDALRASFSTTPVRWDASAGCWTVPQDGGFDMVELMKVSNRRAS